MRAISTAAAVSLAAAAMFTTAGAASASQDTDCQRAGMNALKSLGVFSAVAKGGLPIEVAVNLGVTPRQGTDISALPNPLPLSVVLADHRAGDQSLFIYPWC